MESTQTTVDPVLVAVIGNRLDAITKDIGNAMLRTSRSPIFSEARDFVTAIFDGEARLIAQTAYIPVIAGTTPHALRSIAETFDGDVNPGDVFILNDPYRGNNHAPDVTIARPVFWNDELRFWTMGKGHHADTGGGGSGVVGYNPTARDCWEEAIRIPPAKLIDGGKLRKDLWDLILSNVRIPFLVEGDLSCQIGATAIGERGLIEMLDKFGGDTVAAAIDELVAASERHTRAEIAKIPDGAYSAERAIDNDGIDFDHMPTIRLTVKVHGDEITFDFSESDPQTAGFVNSTYANTTASAHLAFFAAIDPAIRYNEGAVAPVDVVAPEGLVVNPAAPAPTTACTVATCETITEAVWIALSEAIPGQVQSAWARWFGPAIMGFNPRTGRPFADLLFLGKGGGGATEGYDGWDHVGTVVCLGGLRSPDPELHEMVDPFEVLEYEYLTDSAGAGEWRGGLGVVYRWRNLADGVGAVFYGSGGEDETAPVGLLGGDGAPKHRLTIERPDASKESIVANKYYAMNTGDYIETYCSGGGGFGDARRRPVEKVVRDVRDGVVSVQAARESYGVAIDPQTLEVDEAETGRLRAGA
jgi:N-methylhydantoinase B